MVNVYDFDKTDIAKLGKNENLINSCMSIDPKLTPSDVRRNLDLAWGIVKRHALSVVKKERKPPMEILPRNDGAICLDCGSINLTPTGNCAVCIDCGASQGCS